MKPSTSRNTSLLFPQCGTGYSEGTRPRREGCHACCPQYVDGSFHSLSRFFGNDKSDVFRDVDSLLSGLEFGIL